MQFTVLHIVHSMVLDLPICIFQRHPRVGGDVLVAVAPPPSFPPSTSAFVVA